MLPSFSLQYNELYEIHVWSFRWPNKYIFQVYVVFTHSSWKHLRAIKGKWVSCQVNETVAPPKGGAETESANGQWFSQSWLFNEALKKPWEEPIFLFLQPSFKVRKRFHKPPHQGPSSMRIKAWDLALCISSFGY